MARGGRRSAFAVLGAVVVTAGVASCSKTPTKQEVIDELVNKGMNRDGATCIVEKAEAKGMSLERISKSSGASQEDEDAIKSATIECMNEGRSPL